MSDANRQTVLQFTVGLVLAGLLMVLLAVTAPLDSDESDMSGPQPEETEALETVEPCAYEMASRDLRELTLLVQADLNDLTLPDGVTVTASASEFGEYCVFDGERRGFAAMQTDYTLEFVVDERDPVMIGDAVAAALGVLGAFPRDETPGPNDGVVDIQVRARDEEDVILQRRLDARDVTQLLTQAEGGAALFEALTADE